jgi:membrane associated rhomboid family serine protease
MGEIGTITLLLILVTTVVSIKGLRTKSFFEKYRFEVDRILINKEYWRLITSSFLHVSWTHLLFNMMSLYAFSGLLELQLGEIKFLLLYFSSLLGGDLLSLFVHRNHGDYRSVGASGAVCGIIFASIALFPGIGIGFFGLPFSIPSWLYGILYIAYTIYGVKSDSASVGHEAHLGGALAGMLVAIAMQPSVVIENFWIILFVTLPTLAFIILMIKRPHILLLDNFGLQKKKRITTSTINTTK